MKKAIFAFAVCLLVLACCCANSADCLAQSWLGQSPQPYFLPSIPKEMTLCGEPVPLDQPFVAEQLDREFNISVHNRVRW